MQHDGLSRCADLQLSLKQLEPDRHPERPLILLIHGALADHESLLPWAGLWAGEYDLRLVDLPGHGKSEIPPRATFAAFVAEIRELVARILAPRPVVIVGESLGGLIGIAAGNQPPSNLAAVAALDPPLSTAGLWPVIDHIRLWLNLHPRDAFLRDFAFEIFGVGPDTDIAQDRRYHEYFENLAVPALVLAGDQPLGRRRPVQTPPSLIGEVDREVLRALTSTRFRFEIFPNAGHLIPAAHPLEAFAAVRRFIESLPAAHADGNA
ncbi:MAG: alpha/beta fold hydrolase [Rhodospirillaceae bacterium]